MPGNLQAEDLDRWLNDAHKNAAGLHDAGQAQKRKREEFLEKATSATQGDQDSGTVRLTPEQKWAVEFAKQHINTTSEKALQGIIIAHSMGMGKTLIGIKASQLFMQENRTTSVTVITTLPVLRDQWQAELSDATKAGVQTFFVGEHQGVIKFRKAGDHSDTIDINGRLANKIGGDGLYQLNLDCVSEARAVYAYLQKNEDMSPYTDLEIQIQNNIYHTPDDFFTGIKIKQGSDLHKNDPCLAACDYIIISHDLFRIEKKRLDDILQNRRKLLVVDEAQRAKNQKDDNLHDNIKQFDAKRLLLTGTPMEISIDNVWSLAALLVPNKTRQGIQKILEQQVLPNEYVKNATALLNANALITKYNNPEQNFGEYTDRLKTKYKQMVHFINTCMFAFMDRVGPGALTAELRQQGVQRFEFCAVCPADFVPDMTVEGMLIPSEKRKQMLAACINRRQQPDVTGKTIVFYRYDRYYDEIEQVLTKRCGLTPDANFKRLFGNTKGTERKQIIRDFETNDEITVLVANIQVGGVGLNLQNSANMIIFVNTDWNPAVVDQAAGRIWRRGQERDCCILHILAEKDEGQTEDFKKRNKDDSTQKVTDEFNKFKVMMSRIIANTNFLDGKYLAGDDSDMLRAVTGDGTGEGARVDWVQFLRRCQEVASPQRPEAIKLQQVEFDLKNVIDVSIPPDGLNLFDRYRIEAKPATLPIYTDVNNEHYTEAFLALAMRIRQELMAKTYYCDLHRAWFFKGTLGDKPPLFYPLADDDQRMQNVPEKYRLTFRLGLAPAPGDATWQHTDPFTDFNRQNQDQDKNCDGIFCLDADKTGADVDADLKAHVVALLHLLVRSIPNYLSDEEPYWKILGKQNEGDRIRCYPVPRQFFTKPMPKTVQSPMAVAQACLDILKKQKHKSPQSKVEVVDVTNPQIHDIPDKITTVLVCGGYSVELKAEMKRHGFDMTKEDMVRCVAGGDGQPVTMVTRDDGWWQLTPGSCKFLQKDDNSMMDVDTNIVYRVLKRDECWKKKTEVKWTFQIAEDAQGAGDHDKLPDVYLELDENVTVEEAQARLKEKLQVTGPPYVSEEEKTTVNVKILTDKSKRSGDKLKKFAKDHVVKYTLTRQEVTWTFQIWEGSGDDSLSNVDLKLDQNVTVKDAQAKLKEKLQKIDPPYTSEEEEVNVDIKNTTGKPKRPEDKLSKFAVNKVVQITLSRQRVTWTFRNVLARSDEGSREPRSEVKLKLSVNASVQEAQDALKRHWEEQTPPIVTDDEYITVTIKTDLNSRTRDKLNSIFTGSVVPYELHYKYKTSDTTWTFQSWDDRDKADDIKKQSEVVLTLSRKVKIKAAELELLKTFTQTTLEVNLLDGNGASISNRNDFLSTIASGQQVWYQKKSTEITVTWAPLVPTATSPLKNATFGKNQTVEDLYRYLTGENDGYAWQVVDATGRDLPPNKQKIVEKFEKDEETYKVFYKYTEKQRFYIELQSQVDAVNKSVVMQRLQSKKNKKIVGVQEKTDTGEIEVTVKENYTHGDLVKVIQEGDAVKVTLLTQDGQPLAADPPVIANGQHVVVRVEPLPKMHWNVQVVQGKDAQETYEIEEVGDASDMKRVLARVKKAFTDQYNLAHPGNTTKLSFKTFRKDGDKYVLPVTTQINQQKNMVPVAEGNSVPTDAVSRDIAPGDLPPSDPMPM
tara:strand:- start:2950 stop:7953 length:5004 start_codon:yes stop_codon:yes gene_type:complete